MQRQPVGVVVAASSSSRQQFVLLFLLLFTLVLSSSSSSSSSSCPSYCTTTTHDNNDDNRLRIFYLIIVHNERTLHDAVQLVRAIRHPRNTLLIHLDSKFIKATNATSSSNNTRTVLHHELQDCPCTSPEMAAVGYPRIGSVFDVQWSHWSMNEPTLWGMQQAVELLTMTTNIVSDNDNDNENTRQQQQRKQQELRRRPVWDVFINLSGDTFPVYTPDTLADLLSIYRYNFVTSASCETGFWPTNVLEFPTWWHKRAHYTKQESLSPPNITVLIDNENYLCTGNSITNAIINNNENNNNSMNNGYLRNTSSNPPTKSTSSNTATPHNLTLTMTTHFGSQWVILQPSVCLWLVRQLQPECNNSLAVQYRDYLIDNNFLMTDETYLASLLMAVAAAEKDGDDETIRSFFFDPALPRMDEDGFLLPSSSSSQGNHTQTNPTTSDSRFPPNMWAIRYERMDEHVPTAFGYFPTNQRYQVPQSASAVADKSNSATTATTDSFVEAVRPWGPYFLGVYDLNNIRESGALFIRKISERIDDNMIRLLPVDSYQDIPAIQWPVINQVSLSDKPDWERKKAQLLLKQQQQQRPSSSQPEEAQEQQQRQQQEEEQQQDEDEGEEL